MDSKKLPPFGKALADRQRFNNPPWLVVVCVGAGCWESAKARNQRGDSVALVLPAGKNPGALVWPVAGCLVVIEWRQPAPEQTIIELVRALLTAGAESVVVWPTWIDYGSPDRLFDTLTQGWVQVRETIRVYRPRKEAAHVAR